ncbi:BgtTE-56055 [Blumeria graminis f. sp. tritici]|uniref:BgtTE-56055 n=1 Tax=Blumeria graminis f. sp. tritici TaxID=62690 RepID=A0A9X9MGS6_BLUGR|nr:BgtTE-56055 [Blumeria graminis f. sp. tritici]
MPWISFASSAAKLWLLFLHSKSTLIREYLPRGTSQKP